MGEIVRRLLIVAGTVFLALGIVGIVVPVLPTTPFLLLAAACYARGSQRFYRWLMGNRYFGDYIRNYREGRGIPLRLKAFTIALLWITIGYSAGVVVSSLSVRIVLIVIAVGVTAHIVTVRTLRPRDGSTPNPPTGTAPGEG